MICVTVASRKEGLVVRAVGHADYAPRGRDIVCAAVSALLYAYLDTLRALLPQSEDAFLDVEEREGYLMIRSGGLDGGDRAGFAVVEQGLRRLARAYPDHIRYGGEVRKPEPPCSPRMQAEPKRAESSKVK